MSAEAVGHRLRPHLALIGTYTYYVTPYGIAIQILFLGLVPDFDRLASFARFFGIIVLHQAFMLVIRLIS